MEDALELVNYLPLSFKNSSEQKYIASLWDAFEVNYQTGIYQFAFLPYHMLMMTFIYSVIWQIRKNDLEKFKKYTAKFSKNSGNILSKDESPFTFSIVPERKILRILKLINCDNSKIDAYVKFVDDRNDIAHANGNIFFQDQHALNIKIKEILRVVDEIQVYSRTIIQKFYKYFLIQSYDEEKREYYDSTDQVREILIHNNYMSQKDIETCMAFDVTTLRQQTGFSEIAALHQFLCESYM